MGASVEDPGPVGICLSGGGIRAAAFGLGALQALQAERGLIKGEAHAAWIAAVSGGSYTAGAVAMVGTGHCAQPYEVDSGIPETEPTTPRDREVGANGHPERVRAIEKGVATYTGNDGPEHLRTVAADHPMEAGSPEVNYVRARTRYLVEETGVIATVISFAGRSLLNALALLLIISVPAVAGGTVIGLTENWWGATNEPGKLLDTTIFATTLQVLGAFIVSFVVIVRHRRARLVRTGYGSSLWNLPFASTAAFFILYLYLIPSVILRYPRFNLALDVDDLSSWKPPVLVSALVVGATSVLLGADRSAVQAVGSVARRFGGALRRVLRWAGVLILTVSVPLAALLVTVTLEGFVISFFEEDGLLIPAIFSAALLTFGIFVMLMDANMLSLHQPYRRRLFYCFGAMRRQRGAQGALGDAQYPDVRAEADATGPVSRQDEGQAQQKQSSLKVTAERGTELRFVAEGRDPDCEPRLSDVAGADANMPELVICAAANVTTRGVAAAGARAVPFIFSREFTGVPDAAESHATMFETRHLENALLKAPYRWRQGLGMPFHSPKSQALFDLSLPAAVAITGAALSPVMGKFTRGAFRSLLAFFNIRLGVWLPNPLNPDVRERVESWNSPIDKKGTRLGTPNSLLILREAIGSMDARSRWVYVSDGGHLENLGLVELLRRRCGRIWCIDASGDRPGSASTIAQAIISARGELGISFKDLNLSDFELDPQATAGRNYRVKAAHTTGQITYADGSTGQITIVKLGLPVDAPSELSQFQQVDHRFPYHSTTGQVYKADLFDAYTKLGHANTLAAIRAEGIVPGS